MKKIPTAKEFLKQERFPFGLTIHAMEEFAKMHVTLALKEASEKAKITERKKVIDNTGGYIRIPTIYKKHILEAYPLDNIK